MILTREQVETAQNCTAIEDQCAKCIVLVRAGEECTGFCAGYHIPFLWETALHYMAEAEAAKAEAAKWRKVAEKLFVFCGVDDDDSSPWMKALAKEREAEKEGDAK
jgi:hypothetical protein